MAKAVVENIKIRLELMRLVDQPNKSWKKITKNILHNQSINI